VTAERKQIAGINFWRILVMPVIGVAAFAVAWLFFYGFGQALLTIADSTGTGR